ncbi:MAG TPA: hypothetical protein VMW09_02470 [Desulfatiglandales bacterium]|nr:hypothetical protein [Desulfatiglandales bacterium]
MAREREEKPVQFPIDAGAYEVLKHRAKTLGISTGRFVENLLGSLELRLKRAYNESKIDPSNVCQKSDRMMIEVILKADQDGNSDNWKNKIFVIEFMKIRQEILFDVTTKHHWEPEIQLSNKDKD